MEPAAAKMATASIATAAATALRLSPQPALGDVWGPWYGPLPRVPCLLRLGIVDREEELKLPVLCHDRLLLGGVAAQYTERTEWGVVDWTRSLQLEQTGCGSATSDFLDFSVILVEVPCKASLFLFPLPVSIQYSATVGIRPR